MKVTAEEAIVGVLKLSLHHKCTVSEDSTKISDKIRGSDFMKLFLCDTIISEDRPVTLHIFR
jgi:hypothetical protein